MKTIFITIFFMLGIAMRGNAQHDQKLAAQIIADKKLDTVYLKATNLLSNGFNAGDGYPQVWIRDFNTFIETSCKVYSHDSIRANLLTFLRLQQPNGEIVDGYVLKGHVTWNDPNIYTSPNDLSHVGFKNTVETDQETSLIQAIAKYISITGDRSILQEMIAGKTVLQRLDISIAYLLKNRYSTKYHLLTGATTQDWGDVQIEGGTVVDIDKNTHWAIDIYDNAMFIIALNDMASFYKAGKDQQKWQQLKVTTINLIRKHLWDAKNHKFIPHLYLDKSPFPANFDENKIHFHGGSAIAIEAGILSKNEIALVNQTMLRNVKLSGAPSIGLTLYPIYPENIYKNSSSSKPYIYQNGGDWTWFGARMIQQLIRYGFIEEAYKELQPMLNRTIKDKGFYEWYGIDGKPNGSAAFKGSAGVLAKAIDQLKEWASVNILVQDSLFIIPKPLIQQARLGHFTFPKETQVFSSKAFINAADLLHEHPYIHFKKIKPLTAIKQMPKQGIILVKANKKDTLAQNAYRLLVEPKRIIITAHQPGAIINAIATLTQIADTRKNGGQIPAVWIEDRPAFGYRGLMLDVSRHFFPISFLKKYIDIMFLYKLNTFHWHLTDGPGWRLEIKKYPELTQKAAWRTNANWKYWWNNGRKYAEMGTPEASGGFYTADQAKDLVNYAAKRGITVIPEIEMPAHSEEVLATYPSLSCYGVPYKNAEFCIGNEETFTFLQNVLDEVMSIFPSKYIHIGGDEADKSAWKTCSKCQKIIRDFNLKDENGLQSYAIKKLEAYLTTKGRKLIGWDEILEGGLPPEATVMSWRGEKGGVEAANAGHDVIMTPAAYLYFDSYQTNPSGQPEAIGGYLPLQKVYAYRPVPVEINADNQKHILGVQANIWTEHMPTSNQADYMAFPRVLALAEVAWTAEKNKSWNDFQLRLQKHYLLLQRLNVNYYPPSTELSVLSDFDIDKKTANVTITSEQFEPSIHYTVDGSTPTATSPLYHAPISLSATTIVKAAIFKDGIQIGKIAELEVGIHKAIGKKVIYNNSWSTGYPAQKEITLVNGQTGDLTYGDGQWQGFLGDFDVTIDMDTLQPLSQLKIRFMQSTGPGVYIPAQVTVAVSEDGKVFKTIQKEDNDVPYTDSSLRFKTFAFDLKGNTARYIRITGKNEKRGFMFTDEVVVY